MPTGRPPGPRPRCATRPRSGSRVRRGEYKGADGAWRVIELGDGQVSDLPTTTDPGTFIAAVISPTG